MSTFSRFFCFAKNFLAQVAIVSLILEQFIFVSAATAQTLPITPDGTTNTQVTHTASGIDQVNIAAPNASGMSHNRFTDYNVNQSGQIINNFSGRNPAEIAAGSGATAVTQTQIGGLVAANSNLVDSGSAKVILNEVTSNNISQLLGYTEIAGTKADLILANANGIACSGCGFINTAHLVMVAGNSNFDANGNLGFNLKEQANPNLYVPLITVDGLGLDVTRTSSTDIIASSVKLLSSVYGSDNTAFTIKTGEGRYDYATKEITGAENNIQNNTQPVFAIDASSLAKVQAGQVYLIATKKGVGVNMASQILGSQTVNIDANGDVYYASVAAGSSANLKSTQKIESIDSSSGISAPNLTIQANEFKNLGNVSAYNLTVQNSGALTNFGNIEALSLNLSSITNINNSGSIYGENSLSISGENLTNNSSGSIFSPQNYSVILTGLLTNSGVVSSGNNLTVSANQFANNVDAEISAQNNLTFTITDSATNSGNLIAGTVLNFTANSLTNLGEIQSSDDSTFNLATLATGTNSSIYSVKNLNLNLSSALTNSGEISASRNVGITGAAAITNSNKILANGTLSVVGSGLTNNLNGVIASLTSSLALTLSGNLQNNGEFDSVTDLTVSAQNFSNSGNILSSNNLTLTIANSASNSGNLQSAKDFSLTATSLDNAGAIRAFQNYTISSSTIINEADAQIFSVNDATISASTSLNNSGSILSNGKLGLTLGQTINSGEIFSNGDLSFTLTNTLNNSGTISSLGKLDFSSNSSITNTNQILSSGNLTIGATTLTNSNTIQSNSNLTLNLVNLTNSRSIISGGTFDITASGNVANSSTLQSADNFTINAASFTNAASSLILAGKDLTVRASTITNQNTKPSGSTITSGIVSVYGNVVLRTDTLNNNSGIITGKTTSLSALNNSNVVLSNTLGAFISTASISLNLGDIDYSITGTVTASNIDITANNISNSGNVTATDYIKLNATGTGGVGGTVTNGLASGDNSNIQLAAGSYLDISANSYINNYATLSANTNLTLSTTLFGTNNYGSIIGGNGTTTINGNFTNINSSSKITSNNNLIFNVADLNNNGEISVANDLTVNASNNLNNNATALIWSGRDSTFNVANTFTNTRANIYATRNLIIQKNTSNDNSLNKTTSVQNISGSIETYNGDLLIKAASLSNTRTSFKTQNFTLSYGCGEYEHDYSCSGSSNSSVSGTMGAQSSIFSGNTLTINSDSFSNDASLIASVGNASINYSSSFTNNSRLYETYTQSMNNCWGGCLNGGVSGYFATAYKYNYTSESYPAYIKSGGALTITQNGTSRASFLNGSNVAQYASVGSTSGQSRSTTINHVDTYVLGETGVVNVDLSSIADAISGGNNTVNSSGADINSLSLSSNGSGTVFAGSFKINLDGSDTTPLVESRSQFTDVSQFFGSAYYFTQLGLDGNAVLADIDRQTRQPNERATKILGDSFVETKLILDQIRALTNDSLLLSKSTTNTNAQIKELLDNSVAEMARLGLNAENIAMNGLTKAQANSLTKDIITFETTTVDGIAVLAPKIYLSQNTRDRLLNSDSVTGSVSLANSSTIFGKDSVTINAANTDLTNNGSIVSNGNVALNLASITNKTTSIIPAQIVSGNNLSITANISDIKNIGANISSVGSLNLSSLRGNILNSALIQTNDAGLLASNSNSYQMANGDVARTTGNISSSLLQTASIKGGSVNINAANDFTNLAATIETAQNTLADTTISSGNLAVTAGNNVNVETLQLRNRSESTWGSKKHGGTNISDTITNIGSDINVAGNLTSTSSFDTNVVGSNITATGSGQLTSEFGNINVANAVDSKMTSTSAHKSGFGSSSSDQVYDYNETAKESSLNFGSLAVSSEFGSFNQQGSTLTTQGDLKIGDFTVAQNLDGSFKTNANGTYETVSGQSVDGVNITSATLRSEHSESHQKSSLNLGTVALMAAVTATGGVAGLYIANELGAFNSVYKQSESQSKSASTTEHSSTVNVGGNLMINSTGDTNISASNVDVAGSAFVNNTGNFNITSKAETTSSSSDSSQIDIGKLNSTFDLAHTSATFGMQGSGTSSETESKTSTQKSSNINIGGSLLSNVQNDMTLTASNVEVAGDSIVKTGGSFSLNNAYDTTSTSSKESTLTVEAGAKVGNAYVDAAYAWKGVVDATENLAKAVQKLEKIKKLHDEDRASEKAVELAIAQVALADIAVATATLAAASSTAGAAQAASTSLGTGMYGALYLNIDSLGVKNTTDTSTSVGSNFITNGNVDIASNKDFNMIGSNLASQSGNLTVNALDKININAGENTISQTAKMESNSITMSMGNNGFASGGIAHNQSESDYDKTSYTNSTINSQNGTLTLNSGSDANIIGANINTKDLAMNIGGNLNVASKQTEENYTSDGFGFNLGGGAGNNAVSGSAGFSISSGEMYNRWTDNQTIITATNSANITTTKDLNLTGAAILSDNMVLNVGGNINKTDLQDKFYSESMSLGVSTNLTSGSGQNNNTNGTPNNAYPGGATSINLALNESEKNRTVYGVIGGLDTKTVSDTKEMLGADFSGSITVDHRLLSESGRKDIVKDFKELPANVGIIKDNIYKVACESCFVSKEMKDLVKNSDDKAKLPPEYQQALDGFVVKVEKETGVNVSQMTNEERITALNRLKNSNGPLTDSEMRYRDALWATAKDEPNWQQFRSSQITQIANAVINDPSYIETKNKWSNLTDPSKQNYVENLVEKQQRLFGDQREISVNLVSIKPDTDINGRIISWTDGSYQASSNSLSINQLSPSYNDFYTVVNTSAHEYGGHGYQDFAVENKANYLKQNPQFSNMINFFELNYNPKVRAMSGDINYNQPLYHSIYSNKPTEVDAFRVGDGVQSRLK